MEAELHLFSVVFRKHVLMDAEPMLVFKIAAGALGPGHSNSNSSAPCHEAGWGRIQPSTTQYLWRLGVRHHYGRKSTGWGGGRQKGGAVHGLGMRGGSEEVGVERNRLM